MAGGVSRRRIRACRPRSAPGRAGTKWGGRRTKPRASNQEGLRLTQNRSRPAAWVLCAARSTRARPVPVPRQAGSTTRHRSSIRSASWRRAAQAATRPLGVRATSNSASRLRISSLARGRQLPRAERSRSSIWSVSSEDAGPIRSAPRERSGGRVGESRRAGGAGEGRRRVKGRGPSRRRCGGWSSSRSEPWGRQPRGRRGRPGAWGPCPRSRSLG